MPRSGFTARRPGGYKEPPGWNASAISFTASRRTASLRHRLLKMQSDVVAMDTKTEQRWVFALTTVDDATPPRPTARTGSATCSSPLMHADAQDER